MTELKRKFAIYLTAFISMTGFIILTPFYPDIAEDKGLPLYGIGIIISLLPITNAIVAPIISKN